LIRETQAIKLEIGRVESKVENSMTLLSSFSSEYAQWEPDVRN